MIVYGNYINGMEGYLTKNQQYQVLAETQHGYTVVCDLGYEMTFDKCRFKKTGYVRLMRDKVTQK